MDLSWLLGRSKTTFHHHLTTIDLPLKAQKDPAAPTKQTTTSLASLCASATPPCNLNPLLFNGHLQTMYTVIKSQAVPVHYRRHVFDSTDTHYPGTFAVDFAVENAAEEEDKTLHPRTTYYSDKEWQRIASEDDTPMLIALHGLSGGSHELYLRHVLAPLVNGQDCVTGEVNRTNWKACVINARGCSNSKITSPVLFNARATWDIRQIVKWCRKTFPNRPLFGVGFSLGGNILTNYVGEEGEKCELKAVVICSNPWNLEVGNLALQRTWLGKEVYSKAMAKGLKGLYEQHSSVLDGNSKISREAVMKAQYIHEFDREVQCACWGYPTENAYYRDASSTDSLLANRTPLFAIHAEDDPVAADEALPYREILQTPYAVLCSTSMGGHLGWFEVGGGRWFVKPTVNFLRAMAENVDLVALGEQLQASYDAPTSNTSSKPYYQAMRRKMELAR